MNEHIRLPNKVAHKLFYGSYSARLDLVVNYVLTTDPPNRDWSADPENKLYKYKNLSHPLRSLFENTEYCPPRFIDLHNYPGDSIVKTFREQCSDLIAFYHSLPNHKHLIGRFNWTIDPSYAQMSAIHISTSVKFKFYFKNLQDLILFENNLNASEYLDLFHYSQITKLSDQAEKIISGDRHTSVVKKLPYGKFSSKLWLNYSRLRKMSGNEKESALRVLRAYEESGLVKCQPLLKQFLSGDKKFLWNDPYIYVEEPSIKNMLDLVLVNIITRQERIILENG